MDTACPEDDGGGEAEFLRTQIASLTAQFYKDRKAWMEEKRALERTLAQQQQQPPALGLAVGPPNAQAVSSNIKPCGAEASAHIPSAATVVPVARGNGLDAHPVALEGSGDSSPPTTADGELLLASSTANERAPTLTRTTQIQLTGRTQPRPAPLDSFAFHRTGCSGITNLPTGSPAWAPSSSSASAASCNAESPFTLSSSHPSPTGSTASDASHTLPSPPPSSWDATPATAALSPELSRSIGMTLTPSMVNVPLLLADKAALERELSRLRSECVPVPRAQYASLSSVHSQNAFLENELRLLREEAAEAMRTRDAAEVELGLLMEECVPLPRREYEVMMRQAAEARSREARAALEGLTTMRLGVEEHRRLLAAVQERDALAAQVALMHTTQQQQQQQQQATAALGPAGAEARAMAGASSGSSGGALGAQQGAEALQQLAEAQQQVADLQQQLAQLKEENAALGAESAAFRKALVSGQLLASHEAQVEAQRSVEQQVADMRLELAQAQARCRFLESELAACRGLLDQAKADREALAVELGCERDAAAHSAQALADAWARLHDAEGIAAAAREEAAALTAELVEVKLDLAAAKELEVLFKRDVFKSKRMLHGLPQEWMDTAAAAVHAHAHALPAAGASGGGSGNGGASEAGSARGGSAGGAAATL